MNNAQRYATELPRCKEVAYGYGRHAVVRSVRVSQARSGPLFTAKSKWRKAAPPPEGHTPEPRTYQANKRTRTACRKRIGALLHYCFTRRIAVWMDTITFSNRWALSPDQCWAVLQSFNLRVKTSKTGADNLWLWVVERQQNGTLHFHLLHTDSYDVRERQDALRRTLARVAPHVPREEVERWNGLEHGSRAWKGGPKGALRCRGSAVGQYVSKMVSSVSGYLSKAEGETYTRRIWACSHAVSSLPIGEAWNEADDSGPPPYALGEQFYQDEHCALCRYDHEAAYGDAFWGRLRALQEREERLAAERVSTPPTGPPVPSLAQMLRLW